MKLRLLVTLLALPFLGLINACSNIGFYSQSTMGQLSLWWNSEPIETILANEKTPADLKERLNLVLNIRQFASDKLSLPDNDSYRLYVELDRDYVVWNVVGAPEFSLELQQWCFLMVGCLRYRGYFDPTDAQEFGKSLQSEGQDVYVYGVAAYSTLGWFDDPMLNTILKRSEPNLAGLVFHELAHQQLFVSGDTAFNEGFAKTVEIVGVKHWMKQRNSLDLNEEFVHQKQRREEFMQLVASTSAQLKALYASAVPDTEKRRSKQQIFKQMRQQYLQLQNRWGEDKSYAQWFAKDLNNAKLGAIAIYQDYVPAFLQLLAHNNHDLPAFYQAAKKLGELPKPERSAAMQQLLLAAAGR